MHEVLLNLEKSFFRISCISHRDWLDATLHNDFTECGKSGVLFNKDEVMDGLLACKEDRPIEISDFSCEMIGADCWMVHYVTESDDEGSYYRTSVWVREKGLQLRFHQATKLNSKFDAGRRNEMIKAHLEAIAKSYDKGIDLGREGIDPYENLPKEITGHPDYALFQKMQKDGNLSDSGRKEIFDYLRPEKGMKFVDLGCCLNLMIRGYGSWPSTYYGVDISSKTIELLRGFVAKNNIKTGDLYCGSMSDTPYADNFFDIGACIGSLEYFEMDFVEKALAEAHRIIKPYGRFVIDIPNMGTPEFQITARIEEYLGRPDRFNMPAGEFEIMLADYFEVQKKEQVGPMIQYFLINRED